MEITIIDFSNRNNKDQIFQLWKSVLGDTWPVDVENFEELIDSHSSINFIVEDDSEIIGYLSAQVSGKNAALVCVLVEKVHQRKGVGTKLVDTVTRELKKRGVKKLSLGSGGDSYFWPGIPTNLDSAIKFFEKLGWKYSET